MVHALGSVLAGFLEAVVNVDLAVVAVEAGVGAVTRVRVDSVDAVARVLARLRRAVVDVRLAVVAGETGGAYTRVSENAMNQWIIRTMRMSS